MDTAMYIFINDGVGMTRGKIAAQASHAAVEAYRLMDPNSNLLRMWYCGGHYKKLVMRARDTEHLLTIERYLNERGFKTALIVDEGYTEIDAHTPTALGVEIVDKDATHTRATFSSFEVLREPEEVKPARRPKPQLQKRPMQHWEAPLWHRLFSKVKSSVTRDRNPAS